MNDLLFFLGEKNQDGEPGPEAPATLGKLSGKIGMHSQCVEDGPPVNNMTVAEGARATKINEAAHP